MISTIVSRTRPHFATIAALSLRDMEVSVLATLLICGATMYVGHPLIGIVVFIAICALLTVLWLMFTPAGYFAGLSAPSRLKIAILVQPICIILYAIPAMLLAADPSLAIKLGALVFMMGLQTFIANKWSDVPVFNLLLLLPAMAMTATVFLILSTGAPISANRFEWGLAGCVMILFFYTSFETLRQRLRDQHAMFTIKQEASAQLADAENAQRFDAHTGLLTRAAFDQAFSKMLDGIDAQNGHIAIFIVDLDHFQPLNDTYGHHAGDLVLVQTAQRLAACMDGKGALGLLGGDKFILALNALNNVDAAMTFARSLSCSLTQPIDWNDRQLRVTASVGISITGLGDASPHPTVSAMCAAADKALNVAKSATSTSPVLYRTDNFTPSMSAADKRHLIDAVSDGSIKPHYQPKVHLSSGEIIGFEALARWDHPDGTLRRPQSFLDQIDELGLQGDFMIAMARQVAADISTLCGAGLNPGQVSLNVLEAALATHTGRDDLHDIITQAPVIAERLTIEVTEDVFIAHAADAIKTSIASFRARGVRISLDDFGTGFASFQHLRQLEFDELKIDTSFVAGLGQDDTSDVLVRGFLDIAAGLGADVVAEGVETQQQRDELIKMGCVHAQGHLFYTARPLADVFDLLRDQQAT